MIPTGNVQEYEQEYLVVSRQLVDLLQKRTALHEVQSDLERLQNRLEELAFRDLAAQIQSLVNEKSRSCTPMIELELLHGQLIELGRKLGWSERPAERNIQLQELQQRIDGIRAQLA